MRFGYQIGPPSFIAAAAEHRGRAVNPGSLALVL